MNVCGVCFLPVVSHNAYAQHLRGRLDARHQEALVSYEAWLAVHLTTYRCSKCRCLYRREPLTHRSGPGLCTSCRHLKETLPTRTYESLVNRKDEAPVGWDSLVVQQDVWTPNEALCEEVLRVTQGQERVRDAMARLGLSFRLFKAVGVHVLGADAYKEWASAREWRRSSKVGKAHADRYRAMSPDEKAAVLQKRFPRVRSKIEIMMTDVLVALGETDFVTNHWQAFEIFGRVSPREADIKLTLGADRKLVLLCDGEAFHGPGCIFGNPADRIRDDMATTHAYFDAGYSVVRYSETEIKSGVAGGHLSMILTRLRAEGGRIFRLWYPALEEWV